MGKQNWKPGNMLNPVPAVMVSVADKKGNNNKNINNKIKLKINKMMI